jgi:hypothetical protein
MILDRAARGKGGQVAVRVSAESGFNPGYMLKGQAEQAAPEQTAGGYYINAAQAGEAPGRWFGRGAEALGFAGGQVVEAAPFLAVYAQVHPVTGERPRTRRIRENEGHSGPAA